MKDGKVILLLTVIVLTNDILFSFLTVCHKMSTYEFIVSSRDSRPNLSDVEAGTKSPASRKLFKVFAHFLLLENPRRSTVI